MNWLLRLYPRRRRERYAEEVEAYLASEPRSFRLAVDLLAGAVDARLNPQVTPATSPSSGRETMTTIQRICSNSRRSDRYSTPWLIGGSLAFVAVSLVLQLGFDQAVAGQTLLFSAYPLALILAGEHRHLERWPRPVRWIILGTTLVAMFAFFLTVTLIAERF
jgi:hypothetical protein